MSLRRLFIIAICSVAGFVYGQDTVRVDSEIKAPVLVDPSLKCITVPDGFAKAGENNGYIHPQTGASVLVKAIENANIEQLRKSADEAFFKRNNLTLISTTDFETEEGFPGINYECEFMLDTTKFIRNIVYIGDLNTTLWLNFTYPDQVGKLVAREIDQMILTTRFSAIHEDE